MDVAHNQVPLNQIYKTVATLQDHPIVAEYMDKMKSFASEKKFEKVMPNGTVKLRGRIYDDAVLCATPGLDFNNKTVCELGGRDGIFGSWLTQFASKVYVSDYFEEWGKGTAHDLGSFDHWSAIWQNAAPNPDRLICERQDITELTYPDNMFDVVVCTSVVEHIFPQKGHMGDMIAIREMARILKPGGFLLLSTDMTGGPKSVWHSGTFYYTKVDLFDRLINPSRCNLVGPYDFNFDDPRNSEIHNVGPVPSCTSVVFALQKPVSN